MARKGWAALTPDYRARLARGGITQSVYEAGGSLRGPRGHGQSPSNPREALRNPLAYPRYVQRHRAELDALANQLGEPDVATRGTETGERWAYGPRVLTGVDDSLPGYEWGGVRYQTITDARRGISRSHAPEGIAVIVDRGPDFAPFQYEVWFARYPRLPKNTKRARALRRARAARQRDAA